MVIKAQHNTPLARPVAVAKRPAEPNAKTPTDSFRASSADPEVLKMQSLRRLALRPALARTDKELSSRLRDVRGGTDKKVQAREQAITEKLRTDLAALDGRTERRLESLRTNRRIVQQDFALDRSRYSVLGTQGGIALEALLKKPGGKELVTKLDTLVELRETGQEHSPEAKKLKRSLLAAGLEFPTSERLKTASVEEKKRLESYRGVMKDGYAEKRAGQGTEQELLERYLSYREDNKDSSPDFTIQAQNTEEFVRRSEQKERDILAQTATEKTRLKSNADRNLTRLKENTARNLQRQLHRPVRVWDLNIALKDSEILSGTSGLTFNKDKDGLTARERGHEVRIESKKDGHTISRVNKDLRTRGQGTVKNNGAEETEIRRYRSDEGFQNQDPADLAETTKVKQQADGSKEQIVSTYKDGKIERSIEEVSRNGQVTSRRDTRVINDWNTRGISTETTTQTADGPEHVREWAHETTSGRTKGMTHWGRSERRGDTQVERHQFRHPDGTVNTSVEVREKNQVLSKRSLSERPNGERTETLERLRKDGNTSVRETTVVDGKVTERMSATKDAKGKVLHSIKVRPWTPSEVDKDVAGTAMDILSDHPQDLMDRLEGATGKMEQNKQVVEVFDGKTTRKSYSSTWTKGDRTLVKTVGLDKYGMPNGTPVWKLQIQGENGAVTEQTFYQGSEDTVVSKTTRQGKWERTDSTIHPDRHLKNGFGPEHEGRTRRMTSDRANDISAKELSNSVKMIGVAQRPEVAKFLKDNGERYSVEVNHDFSPGGAKATQTQWVIVAEDGRRLTMTRDVKTGQYSQAKFDTKLKEQAQARSLTKLPEIKESKDRGLLTALTEVGRGPANILEGAETVKLLRQTAPHFLRKAKLGRIAATSRGAISAVDLLSGNPVQALTGAGVMLQTGMEVKANLQRARSAARAARGLSPVSAGRSVRTLGFAGAALSGATGVHKFLTSDNKLGKTSGALDALGGLTEGIGFFMGSSVLSGVGIAMAAGALYYERGEQIQIGDIQI